MKNKVTKYFIIIEEESIPDIVYWWYWNEQKGITPHKKEATLYDDYKVAFNTFEKSENGEKFVAEMLKLGRLFFNKSIIPEEIEE